MATSKSALIIGATGATGRHLLRELLGSSHFTRVAEYGRRTTPEDKLADIAGVKEKLVQKTINFDKLSEPDSPEVQDIREGKWDVLFITLGTTRSDAGGTAAFEKIDREYVVNAAKAAKSTDPSHEQRVVYLSSVGANASSSFLYPRSKGMTENALASLGYSDTIVFRPAFLANADRGKTRVLEVIAGSLAFLTSPITSKMSIDVGLLAKSMRLAGELGSKALPPAAKATTERAGPGPEAAQFTLLDNTGAIGLGKSQ